MAEANPARNGWVGLIHRQRERRIECELEKLTARLRGLREGDPGRYYDGDWTEVLDGLIHWRTRDPRDEAQWLVTEENR